MGKEKRTVLKGGVSETYYPEKKQEKVLDINYDIINFDGLGSDSGIKQNNDDLTDTIEQEKAIKTLQIEAKQREIERLKREREMLNKQRIQTQKIYNAVNKKESNISKIDVKRKNPVNLSAKETQIEPMIQRNRNKWDEEIMQNRANILYGGIEKNEVRNYNAGNQNNQSPSLLNEVDIRNKIPYISDPENMFYPNGTLADMPLMKQTEKKNEKKTEKKNKEDRERILEKMINRAAVDFIWVPGIKQYGAWNKGPEAAENLYMSKAGTYLDTNYAKQHLVFNNYLEVNSELQPYLKNKISQQIGEDKLLTTKGIYIEAESDSSKRLAKALINHEDFLEILVNNSDALRKGLHINSSIDFEDDNFHYALGRVDILDLHINKYGDLEMLIADTYDFNNEANASRLVKLGYKRQKQGKIIPYFIIYRVIIHKKVNI